MGQHDTSSLGGIIYTPRLLGELPVEGLNVLRQSGNYHGTEDANADAMNQLAARILRAEPNSDEQAEMLDHLISFAGRSRLAALRSRRVESWRSNAYLTISSAL
jgi:hypothetical protein